MPLIVRVPSWHFEWISDARYYGWKWCAHIGPVMVFIWPCSEAEMDAFWREHEREGSDGRR